MKKLIIALLVIGLLPALALAQGELPPLEHEVASWWMDTTTNTWVQQSSSGALHNPEGLCYLFAQDPTGGYCNKVDWDINVKITVEVAQWLRWSITGTHWKWFVRKPGNYAGDCITGTLASNQDVLVDYDGFNDLEYLPSNPKPSINPFIPIFYAIGDFGTPPAKDSPYWRSAAELNNDDDLVEDSQALHDGIQWKLWNYIHVVNCNSACVYEDDATITLRLQCQKDWIDPVSGIFLY